MYTRSLSSSTADQYDIVHVLARPPNLMLFRSVWQTSWIDEFIFFHCCSKVIHVLRCAATVISRLLMYY